MTPEITAFFHEPTNTASYVVADPGSRVCAVVDSVLDFDMDAGRTATRHADAMIAHIRAQGLRLDWILETHVHADHLSAAPYLRDTLGGRIGIGAKITTVQHTFAAIYNAERGFRQDGPNDFRSTDYHVQLWIESEGGHLHVDLQFFEQ